VAAASSTVVLLFEMPFKLEMTRLESANVDRILYAILGKNYV